MLSTGLVSGSERRGWGAEALPRMEQKQALQLGKSEPPTGAQSGTVFVCVCGGRGVGGRREAVVTPG